MTHPTPSEWTEAQRLYDLARTKNPNAVPEIAASLASARAEADELAEALRKIERRCTKNDKEYSDGRADIGIIADEALIAYEQHRKGEG